MTCRAAQRLLVAAVAVVAALAAPSTAPAAAPFAATGAASSAEQVETRAAQAPGVRTALQRRPSADLHVHQQLGLDAWLVEVRQVGAPEVLASVRLADGSLEVLDSYELPLGDYPPRLTERGVIDEAVADLDVRRTAREWGGVDELRARARLEECCWEVDFFDVDRRDGASSEPVMRVDVRDDSGSVTGVWTGHQIHWKMARGNRAAFGGSVNDPWVWLPMFVLFALVAIDWARLRSPFTADVLAVLALGISHEAFLRGNLDWSVPLALPPLLWLLGRMTWLFARGLPAQRAVAEPRSRAARLALRRVPTIALVVFCVALAGLRIGVTVDGGNVIDVGYAGLAGARLEMAGKAPWGNMPDDNPHGDTYGPVNYLAYVPAAALLDDLEGDEWGSGLPAAQATSIAADLLCVLLLALIGWRWVSRRGAALLAAGWLTCPWTLWALAAGVNDSLLAVPLLAAFAVLPRPALRGTFLGLAVLVKLAPLAVLAPFLHVGRGRRLRQSVVTALAAGLVVLAGIAWAVWRIDDGIAHGARLLWERTLAFQSERGSPFSPWGLYDLDLLQRVAQGLVALAIVVAALRPRVRDAWQVAAGTAALLIAAQLVVTHWFYLYVPWFIGFVLLVLVAARERPASPRYAPTP
ncbi:MAG: hypothetical protein JWO69_1276 [Thermoleophilia bacterium]|nr:hypothetical protein [Thermoleophilia bacterium]